MNEFIPKSLNYRVGDSSSGICPFPGFRPYRTDESHLFFGRDKVLQDLTNSILTKKIVVLTGKSGSGKTSLLNAGLISTFKKNQEQGTAEKWLVVSTTPGNSPVKNLAKSISKEIRFKERSVNELYIENTLRNGNSGLSDLIRFSGSKALNPILIIVDQFEELCIIDNNMQEKKLFINLLIEAYNSSNLPIYIVIGLRTENIESCSNSFELQQIISSNNFSLPDLTSDDLRDIISLPLIKSGAQIDSRLVNQIITDSFKVKDQLPKLQYALKETWNYAFQQSGLSNPISVSDYNEVGALNSLYKSVNFIYNKLTIEEKKLCERVLKSLIIRQNENLICRSLKISDIAGIAGAEVEKVIDLADKLRNPECQLLLPASEIILTTETELTPVHECLANIWPVLGMWVNEEVASTELYKKLANDAEIFQASRTGLLKPPQLFKALDWVKKQRPNYEWAKEHNPAFERTIHFLRLSENEYKINEQKRLKLEKSKRTRKRVLIIFLTTILLAILSMAAIKFFELNKRSTIIDTDKGIKKNSIKKLSYIKIEESKIKPAANNKEFDESNTVNTQSPIKSRDADYINKVLDIANKLAIRSLQIKDDKYLKALLANHAYSFFYRYGEYEYNPDIFNALNEAVSLLYGKYYNVYKGHNDAVNSIVFIPGKNTLYSASNDGRLVEWIAEDKLKRPRLITTENTILKAASVSNNGKWLICSSSNLPLQIFNINDTNIIPEFFKGPSVNVSCLAFMPDNRHFLTAGEGNQVYMWNIETGEYKKILDLDTPISAICADSSGSSLIISTTTGKLILYTLEENESISFEENSEDVVTSIAVSKDGNFLALGYKSGNVALWDYANRVIISNLKGHSARVTDIKFGPGSDILVSTGVDGKILLWAMENYSYGPILIEERNSPVLSVVFCNNGNSIAAGSVNENRIAVSPVKPAYMAEMICKKLVRNLSTAEWDSLVGEAIAYEKACGR